MGDEVNNYVEPLQYTGQNIVAVAAHKFLPLVTGARPSPSAMKHNLLA